MNSVHRYVLNNLVDGRTQDAWDLFTGVYVPCRVMRAFQIPPPPTHTYNPSPSPISAPKPSPVAAAVALRGHLSEMTPGRLLLRVAGLFMATAGACALFTIQTVGAARLHLDYSPLDIHAPPLPPPPPCSC